jgi:hypothetical protein
VHQQAYWTTVPEHADSSQDVWIDIVDKEDAFRSTQPTCREHQKGKRRGIAYDQDHGARPNNPAGLEKHR